MKIKICGITRIEDAMVCIENGVNMIGLNFHPPSPRFLNTERAVALADKLGQHRKEIKLVGVFVNTPSDEIERIYRTCGLDAAQLHGDESAEELHRLRENGLSVFKGFRGAPAPNLFESYLPQLQNDGIPDALIDAYHPGLFGGTGEVMKSDQIGALIHLNATPPKKRIMLAGGLKPENVANLINITQPWGVDSASGVESSPGIKDHQKIIDFCRAVRACKPQGA